MRERLYPYERQEVEEYAKILVERVVMGDEDLPGTVPRLPKHLGWGLESTDQHWVVDTRRIRRELGYRESFLREAAIRRTVEWELANPPDGMDPTQFDYAAEDAALSVLGW